ncbi:hypothetical protein A2U01_0092533, partial [Trifolium medium]|nr:hypothetical protein [Trifolium medium]
PQIKPSSRASFCASRKVERVPRPRQEANLLVGETIVLGAILKAPRS